MVSTQFIMLPVVGALIGLFTNWIAVKMLFHPRKKILGIQGVVPKNKKKIAARFGELAPRVMPSSLEKFKDMPIVGEAMMKFIKGGVTKRVAAFDDAEMEHLIIDATNRELRFVVIAGGFIGLFVGLAQALILGV